MKKSSNAVLIMVIAAILVIAGLFALSALTSDRGRLFRLPVAEKPVIYLYPEQPMDVTVRLDYRGTLDAAYPAYDGLWRVHARPDGTLTNLADGREYSYLFWEGHGDHHYDLTRGFVVAGSDTAAFLQDKLAQIGLIPREYNEMIVHWLPRLQNNAYTLIAFQGEAYTKDAPLTIRPRPDSLLRVFIACKALEHPIDIPEQALPAFERKGFTVVEWGGTIVQ